MAGVTADVAQMSLAVATSETSAVAVPVKGAAAADGDFVILWGSYTQIFGVLLQHGAISNNKYGSFHHDDLIGLPFGSKVTARKGGKVFVEAGTGSGSVSTSLARALQPGGRLHTFEFHSDRQRQAADDFKRYGLEDIIVSAHGDVCRGGFGDSLDGSVDGVFLDLPMPWLAIPHVSRCLKAEGKVCTFSPCIEQIDKTAAELRRHRYRDIRMFETLAVNWAVKAEAPPKRRRVAAAASKANVADVTVDDANSTVDSVADKAGSTSPSWMSYQMPMRGHTGYLMVASKAPPIMTKAVV